MGVSVTHTLFLLLPVHSTTEAHTLSPLSLSLPLGGEEEKRRESKRDGEERTREEAPHLDCGSAHVVGDPSLRTAGGRLRHPRPPYQQGTPIPPPATNVAPFLSLSEAHGFHFWVISRSRLEGSAL